MEAAGVAGSSGWAERVDAIEMRLAHQDRALEDLNGVVTEQWQEIARLRRLIGRLEEELTDARQARGAPLPEPPPPHY